MKSLVLWLVMLTVIALATAALGWWAVPVVAAIWGLATPLTRGTWWRAALAGSGAWALLLFFTATQGPAGELASKVGAVFALPGFAFVILTLLFPAVMAASAAELAGALGGAWRTRRDRAEA
jgi:hypothetical protein